MPLARLVIVIVGAVADGVGPSYDDTVMLNSFVAERAPDTTLIVNADVPVLPGVPDILPVMGLSVSPAGRLPDATDHIALAALHARVAEYDAPAVPEGRLAVVIVSVPGVGGVGVGSIGSPSITSWRFLDTVALLFEADMLTV